MLYKSTIIALPIAVLALTGISPSRSPHTACSGKAIAIAERLLPDKGKMSIDQARQNFVGLVDRSRRITMDSFDDECVPSHIVIRLSQATTLLEPTSSIREIQITEKGTDKIIVVEDHLGRVARRAQRSWPTISLYRFRGTYHLAISLDARRLEPKELGVAVGARGPFLFNLVWPEPGPKPRWPAWPAHP